MLLEIVALSNVGLVRQHNEDSLLINGTLIRDELFGPTLYSSQNPVCALMIADGMGGHARGALASNLVLSYLASAREDLLDERTCKLLISATNDAVYDCMDAEPQSRGMGTTIVGMALSDSEITHFNVGDSRAYRQASGELVRLTHDDVPPSLTRTGQRVSHQITQSLGGQTRRTRVHPHFGRTTPLEIHEMVLLCSDGLTDMIEETQISQMLVASSEISSIAGELLDTALRNGGRDNISLIIAKRVV